jgi:hypothetical protein
VVTFAAGCNQHFSFVLETVSASKQLWNQLSTYHAITALGIGDFLSAKPANLPAHVPVHDAPDKGHSGHVVHAGTDKKRGLRRGVGRRQKSIDLFRKMLAVGIEKDGPFDLSIWSDR